MALGGVTNFAALAIASVASAAQLKHHRSPLTATESAAATEELYLAQDIYGFDKSGRTA